MSTHLVIERMPRNTSSVELRRFCTVEDVSVSVVVVRVNPITGRGQGIGLVTFASVDDAARASDLLGGKLLGGKAPTIRVPTADEIVSFAV